MSRQSQARAQQAANAKSWNARNPSGTRVSVRRDDGTALLTVTTSEAWVLGGHTAVVMVDGISGGYMLGRVSPIADAPTASGFHGNISELWTEDGK